MFKWSDRQPRPNVRMHALDVHALPQRLRGEDVQQEVNDYDRFAYGLAALVAWSIALAIVVFG